MADTFEVDTSAVTGSLDDVNNLLTGGGLADKVGSCGANPGLEAVAEINNAIKEAIAEGKAALAEISSKANEALAELNSLQEELPSLDSVQADFAALVQEINGEFSTAVAEFKEKWGEALSDSELQELLDKVTAFASDPLSILEFDPCADIPNVTLENGQRVDRALTVSVPNVNVPELPAFEPTVVDGTQQPSTASPSGGIFARAMAAGRTVHQPAAKLMNDHYAALRVPILEIRNELREDPLYAQVQAKSRTQNFNVEEARKRNQLTEEEQIFKERLDRLVTNPLANLNERKTKMNDLFKVYQNVITGVTESLRYDRALDAFNLIPGAEEDQDVLLEVKAIYDENVDQLTENANYNNAFASRFAGAFGINTGN